MACVCGHRRRSLSSGLGARPAIHSSTPALRAACLGAALPPSLTLPHPPPAPPPSHQNRTCRWRRPSRRTSRTCWGARCSRRCISGWRRAGPCTCCPPVRVVGCESVVVVGGRVVALAATATCECHMRMLMQQAGRCAEWLPRNSPVLRRPNLLLPGNLRPRGRQARAARLRCARVPSVCASGAAANVCASGAAPRGSACVCAGAGGLALAPAYRLRRPPAAAAWLLQQRPRCSPPCFPRSRHLAPRLPALHLRLQTTPAAPSTKRGWWPRCHSSCLGRGLPSRAATSGACAVRPWDPRCTGALRAEVGAGVG